MWWAVSICGGLVLIIGLLFVWGLLHLRQSRRKAEAEIRLIELVDIEPLARECVDVFRRKLGINLDLNDCEDTAQKLDDAFQDRKKLKDTFARADFYWYFVKPVGACLGELLRRHAKHQWRKQTDAAPFMEVALRDGTSEVYPFEKVIKHITVGEPGDLVAYMEFAKSINQTV
ncbi:MAG TPA: hypothetical protein VHR66_15555 [Gemmataceae bacterium]|jgi:hypothetical protein|nr:hypothetical protein [Gemmataceae bacterium]